MPQRRIPIGLASVFLVMVAGFSGLAGLRVGATSGDVSKPGAWSLLGVRDDGRTLLIRGAPRGACDRNAVTADESHPDRVVITSRILTSRGGGTCIMVALPGDDVAVRLQRPIDGRAVVGERRKRTTDYDPSVIAHVRDDRRVRRTGQPISVPDRPPPNVVGLRFRDARHALCNAGFEARRPRGSTRIGMVVAQSAPTVQPLPRAINDIACTNGVLPVVCRPVCRCACRVVCPRVRRWQCPAPATPVDCCAVGRL